MARKLLFGNDILSFSVTTTPSSRTGICTVNGNFPVERVLIINDVTTNSTLYAFSDPTSKITCTQDFDRRQTTISLSSVPSTTNSSDKVEIYLERDEVDIKPTRTYRDPVSKFRVSQGESIIDTDFEYGLQPTKWETLRLVNNVPTYFSSIFEDEAISASSISVQAGGVTGSADKVTVRTDEAHNLVKGSLIEITGLTDVKYEGVYIITDVPDTTTFVYTTTFSSTRSLGNIQTIYTLIYPGSFYTGSGLDVADVQFVAGPTAPLTVSTPNIHGFKNDTKIYLKQSRVIKSYDFESRPLNLNASDVVGFGTTSLQAIINPSLVSSGTNVDTYYTKNKPFIEDDWIGKFEINFVNTDINTTNNTISYKISEQLGDASTDVLQPNDCIMMYTPRSNNLPTMQSVGTAHTFRPLVVLSSGYSNSSGIVTFKVGIGTSSNATEQDISDVGTNSFGRHRIVKGVKIFTLEYRTNWTSVDNKTITGVKVTYTGACNFKKGDLVVLTCSSPLTAGAPTDKVYWSRFNHYFANVTLANTQGYHAFPVIDIPITGGYFILGADIFGRYPIIGNVTGVQNLFLTSYQFGGAFNINEFPLNNAFYLPPRVGFSTLPFETGDWVGLTTTSSGFSVASSPWLVPPKPTNLIGLFAGSVQLLGRGTGADATRGKYILRAISGYDNWFRLYKITDGNFVDVYSVVHASGANAVDLAYNTNVYEFKLDRDRRDRHTLRLKDQPKFPNNNQFRYSSAPGATAITGLNPLQIYVAKSNESTFPKNFRVGNDDTKRNPAFVFFRYPNAESVAPYNGNRNYAAVYVNSTNVSRAGIFTGQYLQISGVDPTGREPVARMVNTVFRVPPTLNGISTQAANNRTLVHLEVPVGFNTDLVSPPAALTYINIGDTVNPVPGTQVCGIITFASIGVGTQIASLNNIGVVDDIYPIIQSQDQSFVLQTSYTIPEVIQTTFNGPNNVGVGSTPAAWIKLTQHLFADGAKVKYNTDDPLYPIGELSDNSEYYVRVLDGNHIALALTNEVAVDRNNTSGLISFSSDGSCPISGGNPTGINTHKFSSSSAKGFVIGNANQTSLGLDKVGFSSESNIITGQNGTTFLSDFASGDLMRIYQLNESVGPGTYFQSKIISVKSNTILQIEDPITPQNLRFDENSGVGTGNYFVPTRAYVLTDAKATHRPFDGGVTMAPGVSANSRIIRQTRRYFRYQSGKGIQCSMAVNFNPTYDIETITGIGTTAIVVCKAPHGIPSNYVSDPNNIANNQKVKIYSYNKQKELLNDSLFSGTYDIKNVIDDFQFRIEYPYIVPEVNSVAFLQYNVLNWKDAELKAGMFDDQNGFFYKYDGRQLFAVRRSSTQQLSGTITVDRNNHTVTGTNTLFSSQVEVGDTLIIRGQSYKVITIKDNVNLQIQPAYRGQDSSGIIISKVIDTEIPQSQWNLDRCDGTGSSGYNLDINRIQMIYMDYSWYGAGSIRFGFKNQDGEVFYCHEFLHNNQFTESYFRSGNLPARYEVSTGDAPGFGPSLFHWGSSVIMDGRFDDDKAYLFTGDSDPLPFTNGGRSADITGTIAATDLKSITGIDLNEAVRTAIGMEFVGNAVDGSKIQKGTKVASLEINPATPKWGASTSPFIIGIDKPGIAGAVTFNLTSGTATLLRGYIPLVSIRLAPSVDNSTTGNLGFRDIITRMQLTLKSAGVLVTHDCEVRLYLNPRLSRDNWVSVGAPSLAQLYKHQVGDSFTGGIKIYSFRASGGAPVNTATNPPKRGFNVTTVSLDELALLGNSILGGDGVYPDGPDVLTIAVKPIDTSQITGAAPFIASSRITWSEAQA